MLAESKENTRLQINHAAKLEQKELDNNRIEENKQHISNIRDILNKAIGGVSEVRGA
jgi:hypothetical protein